VPNILRYVEIPTVDRDTCSRQLGKRLGLGEMCAGSRSGDKDSCTVKWSSSGTV